MREETGRLYAESLRQIFWFGNGTGNRRVSSLVERLRGPMKELLHGLREVGIKHIRRTQSFHPPSTIVQAFLLETKDASGP